jgi:hypothetical protein
MIAGTIIRPALFQHVEWSRRQWLAVPERDLLHDSTVRYAGYVSEVTQSTKDIVWIKHRMPYWNPLGWLVTGIYCTTDITHKTMKAYRETLARTGNHDEAKHQAIYAFKQTLAFQGLASMLLPFLTVVSLKAVTTHLLKKVGVGVHRAKIWGAVAGLSTILVAPILADPLVNRFLSRLDARWN